jgi:hypothetical protein
MGIVACGKVIAEWDGERYEDQLYEGRIEQGNVYKIKVNWHKDLTNSAIPYKKLAKCGSFSVTQTLQEIKNLEAAINIQQTVESS